MGIYQETEQFLGKPITNYNDSIDALDPIATVYRLRVEYDSEYSILDLLARFVADANARKITSLIIGMWDYDDSSQAVVELLVSIHDRLPNLTAIFIGDIEDEENQISWIQQSDLSPLLNAYPQLEYLQVRGNDGLSFGNLKHDRLKTLIVETGGLSVNRVREVCNARLPQLEHLELWLGTDDYGGDATVEDLAPILAGTLFPKLTYLGLRDSIIADSVATAVATAPVMQQLKVLDLSLGNIGDIGATALLASPYLHHLEKLDLNHHYISDELVSQLENLTITVDVSDVQAADEYGGEEYRYIAVAE
jgi:Leucine Rich repeat